MAKGIRRIAGGWQLRIQVAGKAYCKTIQAPDSAAGLRQAVKDREAWAKELGEGINRSACPTFGELAQSWLNGIDVKPSTRSLYKSTLNSYWMPVMATKSVQAIRPFTIREHLSKLNLSGKTKANILGPLRGVFDLAIEELWIDANPVAPIRLKRHQKPAIERFTPAEKAKILDRLEGDCRLYALILFEAGMRPGEVLGLEWADFDGASLRVSKAIVRRKATTTKTSVVRVVHCSPVLRAALVGHPRRFKGGPVFVNQYGRAHSDTVWFNTEWKRALAAARVPYRIPYVCRHTRASDMLMAGVQPAFAARQLGHTLDVFFRTYAAWINSDRDAVELAKLDQAASG